MTTDPTHPSEEKIKEIQAELNKMVTALNSASVMTPSTAKKRRRPQLRSGNAKTVTARRNE